MTIDDANRRCSRRFPGNDTSSAVRLIFARVSWHSRRTRWTVLFQPGRGSAVGFRKTKSSRVDEILGIPNDSLGSPPERQSPGGLPFRQLLNCCPREVATGRGIRGADHSVDQRLSRFVQRPTSGSRADAGTNRPEARRQASIAPARLAGRTAASTASAKNMSQGSCGWTPNSNAVTK